MVDEKAIETAFHLQIELATRVATNRIPAGQGLLVEALASLEIVLDAALRSLVELEGAQEVAEVAALTAKSRELLTPFLTEWHPKLKAHHAERPVGVDVVTHERTWPLATALREELAVVQDQLAQVLDDLGDITGCSI
jgi:hypothetical protein